MNHAACLKSIWTLPYFQLQGSTINMNHKGRFKSFWTLPYLQLHGLTLGPTMYFLTARARIFQRFPVIDKSNVFLHWIYLNPQKVLVAIVTS